MSTLSDFTIVKLKELYPNATYELNWQTPEQLLIATILAAQCTDVRVNKVTATLFEKYPDLEAFAHADRATLEEEIKSTGFYKQKAESVIKTAQTIVRSFGGRVPQDMNLLTSIKGIARKTANVVLNCAFNIPSGIIVDTHVLRNAQRMGFSKFKSAEKIEEDLMRIIPQDEWTTWGPAMILHGRRVCKASKPNCAACPFEDQCPKIGVLSGSEELDDEDSFETRSENIQAPIVQAPIVQAPIIQAPAIQAPTVQDSHDYATLPSDWAGILQHATQSASYEKLQSFLESERENQEIFPSQSEVFTAFHLTALDQLKVVILGQDPYHDVGQAHGLSFSVKKGIKVPPSLVNMYKELKSDLGLSAPTHGNLTDWAKQGVMMLNTVLTVRAHQPNSHRKQGWEKFTDEVIKAISQSKSHVVFILWGKPAHDKIPLIDRSRHTILQGAHPSPLSAHTGFFGSKPYSQANEALIEHGQSPIDWQIH
jgi:uracil-DNA glycosylase